MTTMGGQRARRPGLAAAFLGLLFLLPWVAAAITLDDRGEMRLGMRTYTDVRIGTEKEGGTDDPESFPRSGAGHLHQHRYFLELKLDHDITRLAKEAYGVAALFRWLDPNVLKYSMQYRGEGEGLFDYGPREWTKQGEALRAVQLQTPAPTNKLPAAFIYDRVRRLRRNARIENRFFLGYLDVQKGPVEVRIGRQVLAWGETDVFRLLDNINPLDQGFGGFFIPLDERRVPIDMARANYHFGSIGPLADSFLEGFVATGDRVSTFPGIQPGSPWEPGGLGFPNPTLRMMANVPGKTDVRGGARFVFNYKDVTYTLAHYYTYLDVPGVVFSIPKGLPSFPDKVILAEERFPRVPITGGSLTFPLPSWYTIVRSEAAYNKGEPFNRQGRGSDLDATAAPGTAGYRRLQQNLEGGLDPFILPGFGGGVPARKINATLLQSDTFNFALGLDINRYIRWLNPAQTFFISTQFFYKHVMDSPHDLVLPVPFRAIPVSKGSLVDTLCGGVKPSCGNLRPRLFHIDDNQFLHTLLITTSYRSGTVIPSYAIFYDHQGSILNQPGVTFVRDPFRLILDYTRIDGPPTGQIGTLRDRDNVRVQVEFVF